VDKTSQACFRRVHRGAQAGCPRFQGRTRFHSFPFQEDGNGARLANGYLVLSTIGRRAVHWSRALQGTPKTGTISSEADGCYVAISCADVLVPPLPPPGQERGSTGGLRPSPHCVMGRASFPLAPTDAPSDTERYRATGQRRIATRQRGSHRRHKAVNLLAKAHQTVRRQRADFHHKTALTLVHPNEGISHEDVPVRTMVQHHHLAKSIQVYPSLSKSIQVYPSLSKSRAGRRSWPSLPTRRHGPVAR
jgi:putative transposase